MGNDPQADRVIDKILTERKEAQAKLQRMTTPEPEAKEEIIKERVPVGLRRDPDILRLVELGEGKIPDEFLGELVGVKLREGL